MYFFPFHIFSFFCNVKNHNKGGQRLNFCTLFRQWEMPVTGYGNNQTYQVNELSVSGYGTGRVCRKHLNIRYNTGYARNMRGGFYE